MMVVMMKKEEKKKEEQQQEAETEVRSGNADANASDNDDEK